MSEFFVKNRPEYISLNFVQKRKKKRNSIYAYIYLKSTKLNKINNTRHRKSVGSY